MKCDLSLLITEPFLQELGKWDVNNALILAGIHERSPKPVNFVDYNEQNEKLSNFVHYNERFDDASHSKIGIHFQINY